jgi:hypothetical protein
MMLAQGRGPFAWSIAIECPAAAAADACSVALRIVCSAGQPARGRMSVNRDSSSARIASSSSKPTCASGLNSISRSTSLSGRSSPRAADPKSASESTPRLLHSASIWARFCSIRSVISHLAGAMLPVSCRFAARRFAQPARLVERSVVEVVGLQVEVGGDVLGLQPRSPALVTIPRLSWPILRQPLSELLHLLQRENYSFQR